LAPPDDKPAQPGDAASEREIDFRESEGVPIAGPLATGPRPRAWHRRATDPPPTPEELAELAAEQAATPLEVEWMDEDRAPAQGRIFAEPAPEPPLQPFEIVGVHPAPQPAQHAPSEPAEPPRATLPHPGRPPRPASRAAARAADSSAAPPRPPLAVRIFWAFMPALLCVAGFASVVFTQGRLGYTWDEAYYYEPGIQAADWLIEALRGHNVFDRAAIDAAFELRHEHPDLPKFLIGIAVRCFADPTAHLFAMRLPSAVLFGLSLGLLYLIGRRAFGPVPGLVGVLLYWACPRVFGHAHFAAYETPLICMTLLLVFCFLRGLDSRVWAALTGVAFGLVLGTKINGFFVPIPLVIWAHLYARSRYVNNLFAMLTLGPLAMLAVWPWLWHDTATRFLEYLWFHLQHQQTAVFYEGQVWGGGGPNAPWYYPLDILHATLPLSVLFFVILGTARIVLRAPRAPYGALFLLLALVPFAVASLPSTPRYDGERLFLPVFPFLALLGAGGFAALLARITGLLENRGIRSPRGSHVFARWIAVTMGLAIVLEGGVAIARYRPFFLSYFNPLVGGMRGAAQLGYETTYWGEALNDEMIVALNELPDNSRVCVRAMHLLCLRHLQQWGMLDAGLQFGDGDKPPYDYHLVQMRRGFFTRAERTLADGDGFPVVKMIAHQGVRLMGLYKTGPAFEQVWPQTPHVPPSTRYPYNP
jgi:4-amino-4-deoxy-L-arabinose transferase-like glycosyltransferase